MRPELLDALARATLAHGLIQLALHFPDDLQELELSAQDALEHALSCGTLLSHLDGLPGEELEAMTAELEKARRLGRRWTELP